MRSRFLPWLPWVVLVLAFTGTLALETALVERKYGLFSGGFGSSQTIDSPPEWALFLVALLWVQAAAVGLAFLALRALHRRTRQGPVFLLNFLFFAGGGSAALLTAKYQVLSYFSDAMGFSLMKSLGGGSLAEALLYVASDAALGIGAAAAAVAAWMAGLRLARKRLPHQVPQAGLRWRHLLWTSLPLPAVALAAGGEPDVRWGLSRFTAFAAVNRTLSAATDFDGDGWSWFTPQRDAFPFDSARHPFALDVPGNGIDDDGLAGDARPADSTSDRGTPQLPGPVTHVVLVVLESVRGDAVGRRLDGREVTPVLNALAREGTHVAEAYSHVGFTTESMKSLFSGALAPRSGDPSLFRDLEANGYRIGVLSAAPENFGGISDTVGMQATADVYVDAETLKAERAHGSASLGSLALDGRKVLGAFDRHFGSPAAWSRPTFLYLNFQEAHFPYHHRTMPQILPGKPIPRGRISLANRDWVERTYWNAVAYNDSLLGQLIERLKRLGVWEQTLLVVTADHGESLFDDGFLGHGHVINRQQTHVPLILSRRGIVVSQPVGLADYRSLILAALGAQVPLGGGEVFHHVGELDQPVSIGLMERAGRLTTFTLETEAVSFGSGRAPVRYAALKPGTPEKARADRLIEAWAQARWQARRGRTG